MLGQFVSVQSIRQGHVHNWGRTLSLVMASEDLVIALVYMYQGNLRMCIYWGAAAVICAAVAR